MITSPFSSDGFSELLLDENTNFPMDQALNRPTSDSLNSLFSGSIKLATFSSQANPSTKNLDSSTQNAGPKRFKQMDSGIGSNDNFEIGKDASEAKGRKTGLGRSRLPLGRSFSHAGHTPIPESSGGFLGRVSQH